MFRFALIVALTVPAFSLANDKVPTEKELYAAAMALPMPSLTRKLRKDAARFRAGGISGATKQAPKNVAVHVAGRLR